MKVSEKMVIAYFTLLCVPVLIVLLSVCVYYYSR